MIATQYRLIPVGSNGLFAIIDAEDYDREFSFERNGVIYHVRISQLTWHSEAGGRSGRLQRHTTYARSSIRNGDRIIKFRLHCLILGHLPGYIIDHKSTQGLDCRKENLEHVTVAENTRRAAAFHRARKAMEAMRRSEKEDSSKDCRSVFPEVPQWFERPELAAAIG